MSPQEQPDATPDQAVRSAATQLYAGLPAEFVASRTALVKEARDREAARRIGALRRPSVAAWALNQLAHQRAPVIDELADNARELVATAPSGLGSDMIVLIDDLIATLDGRRS